MARFSCQHPNGVAVQELEPLLRAAIFKPANQIVGFLLQQAADQIDANYQPKIGQHRKGREALEVQGMFGRFVLRRDYYYDPQKHQGHYPADAALGLEGSCTPALARLACLQGADDASFQKAQEHLKETGGIDLSGRQIQRLVQQIGPGAIGWQDRDEAPQVCDASVLYVSVDGTGVPMRKEELKGRKGKHGDGKAKTRQAYLGCVFTQHKCDEQGHPIRDHESTSYVSGFQSSEEFGLRLRQEARRRGCASAKKVVLLMDGANGLENLGRLNFSGNQQIVDFYHAMEHLEALLEALWGKEHPKFKRRRKQWTNLLLKDGVGKIIDQATKHCVGRSCQAAVEKQLHYFKTNLKRMKYGTFRKQGYFIGSGVIEAGCKTLIGSRCKQSGMFWSKPGAENILALRCVNSSHQWDQFWKTRANEHAARNDLLDLAA
jgi:hypothetical protein